MSRRSWIWCDSRCRSASGFVLFTWSGKSAAPLTPLVPRLLCVSILFSLLVGYVIGPSLAAPLQGREVSCGLPGFLDEGRLLGDNCLVTVAPEAVTLKYTGGLATGTVRVTASCFTRAFRRFFCVGVRGQVVFTALDMPILPSAVCFGSYLTHPGTESWGTRASLPQPPS